MAENVEPLSGNGSNVDPVQYGDDFYDGQQAESRQAAKLYAERLAEVLVPTSVFDFGCGRGAWLSVFGERGATRLVGYDGPWNRQEDMLVPQIEYHGADLNQAVKTGIAERGFDLAMSLEVAEHLEPENSSAIVKSLCAVSDVVMFGAAFLHQPGTNHINTRRHSEWAAMFASEGFGVHDFFRPAFWGRSDMPYWYQQNTFLYARTGTELLAKLAEMGFPALERLELLDCVHPELLDVHANVSARSLIRRKLKAAMPDPVVRLVRRIKQSV